MNSFNNHFGSEVVVLIFCNFLATKWKMSFAILCYVCNIVSGYKMCLLWFKVGFGLKNAQTGMFFFYISLSLNHFCELHVEQRDVKGKRT